MAGAFLLALLATPPARAASLDDQVGASEVRLLAAPFSIAPGRTIAEQDLVARLERLGYERVRTTSVATGQFFWGHESFHIGRRAFRHGGRTQRARTIVATLRREDGLVLAVDPADPREASLEPETLAESMTESRAPRVPVALDALPEHVWRAVLAAEDHRFFEHGGVDGRALARAMLANAKAGRVVQGGSTITQQLIKNRDLSPKRSLGRKVNEALRALALESEHTKEEILEAYLNHIYWGHVGGAAVHGVGAASRAWFSKRAADLDLAEAASLAAMIQGPNRLAPDEHPARLKERRDWVLSRMEELGWAKPADAARARAQAVRARVTKPARPAARHFTSWVADAVREKERSRFEDKRGFVVETTLDRRLQEEAESLVADHLDRLRRDHRRLRGAKLSAAAVVLDARDGAVLAHVGGDPEQPGDEYDRVRRARRPIGSTVKPLVLLELFERCDARGSGDRDRDALHAATRVEDGAFEWTIDKRTWRPTNYDGRDHGVVSVREALRDSLNVPFARMARHCGLDGIAHRLRTVGLDAPASAPPPALVLGAVDATPLELARAYTVFATLGDIAEPHPLTRIETPAGTRLARERARGERVAFDSTAFVVRDLMRDAVARGTGKAAAIDGVRVAGKTGSTSSLKDAWFAGVADGVVVVVWVGLDDAAPLGLTGSAAAAPLWQRIAAKAARTLPPWPDDVPGTVVRRAIDPDTGLRARVFTGGDAEEWFRRTEQPPRDRWFRRDRPQVVH